MIAWAMDAEMRDARIFMAQNGGCGPRYFASVWYRVWLIGIDFTIRVQMSFEFSSNGRCRDEIGTVKTDRVPGCVSLMSSQNVTSL